MVDAGAGPVLLDELIDLGRLELAEGLAVADLGARALINDIAVMCLKETPDSGLFSCHRRLLLEHTQEITPGLEIDIR